MSGPVVFFPLLIAALWVWSLFIHPQIRCTRCTGAAPRRGLLRTGFSHTCAKCGGAGMRERPGVAALRTLGWDIGPTGRLRRRAHRGKRPRAQPASPQPANPGGSQNLPWSALACASNQP
jgi:hypothetical protein